MDKEPENTDLNINNILLKMLDDAIKEEEEKKKGDSTYSKEE